MGPVSFSGHKNPTVPQGAKGMRQRSQKQGKPTFPLLVFPTPSFTSRSFPGLYESLKLFDLLSSAPVAAYTLFSAFRTHHSCAGDVFLAAISSLEAESCCLAIADTENVYKHMERDYFKPQVQPKCEEVRFS